MRQPEPKAARSSSSVTRRGVDAVLGGRFGAVILLGFFPLHFGVLATEGLRRRQGSGSPVGASFGPWT
jgi:hypothetical protein